MNIETLGSGPPLVLIHGWAMHGGIFAPLSERLAQQHTLHLVDLPGHGRSRDCSGDFTLDHCATELLANLPPAVWLGWSLGALVAIRAAALHPSRVQGLIALCGSPCFVRNDDWSHGVASDVFVNFGRDLGSDYANTIDRFLALEAHGSDHMRDELRALRQQVFARGEPLPRALESGLHILESSDLRASLPQLTAPALWIAGRRDRLVPWQAMEAAAQSMSTGHFLRIEGGGHAPFLSHADLVADAITEFLRTMSVQAEHV